MKKYTREVIYAVLAAALVVTSGCAAGSNNDMQNDYAVPTQTTPDHPKTNDQGLVKPSKDIVVNALSFNTEELALAPGDEYAAKVSLHYEPANVDLPEHILDALTYTSGNEQLVQVQPDGTIVIAEEAEIGSEVIVTAHYKELSTEFRIHVKYSLGDTLQASSRSDGIPVVTNATHMAVIVNKQRSLPDAFAPDNLVQPDVPFSFSGDDEKKLLQEPAALALEQLFAKAEQEHIKLNAVSGYRSYARQTAVFNNHVKNLGEEEARRYSAVPGTSEHQTGLAMDVSSPSVNNGLVDTLGDTDRKSVV